MANTLFGIDIAQEVHSALQEAGGLRPLTLIKEVTVTAAARPWREPDSSNVREDRHAGRGTLRRLLYNQDGTLIQGGRTIVRISGASLPSGIVPEKGDRIEIDGDTVQIAEIGYSSSRASYECIGENR